MFLPDMYITHTHMHTTKPTAHYTRYVHYTLTCPQPTDPAHSPQPTTNHFHTHLNAIIHIYVLAAVQSDCYLSMQCAMLQCCNVAMLQCCMLPADGWRSEPKHVALKYTGVAVGTVACSVTAHSCSLWLYQTVPRCCTYGRSEAGSDSGNYRNCSNC
jgi:hypothetical protein